MIDRHLTTLGWIFLWLAGAGAAAAAPLTESFGFPLSSPDATCDQPAVLPGAPPPNPWYVGRTFGGGASVAVLAFDPPSVRLPYPVQDARRPPRCARAHRRDLETSGFTSFGHLICWSRWGIRERRSR